MFRDRELGLHLYTSLKDLLMSLLQLQSVPVSGWGTLVLRGKAYSTVTEIIEVVSRGIYSGADKASTLIILHASPVLVDAFSDL